MNSNTKLDITYIAGIFDAKGTIKTSKSLIVGKVWRMEVSMADRNVMELIHETLECGELRKIKNQWRWRCRNQDCFFVAKTLWPHVVIKLHKLEQIIDHYDPHMQDLDDNVIELDRFRDNIWFGKEKMNCWHCGTELIWGGDHDMEDNEEYDIITNLSCPNCHTAVDVYHPSEKLIKEYKKYEKNKKIST